MLDESIAKRALDLAIQKGVDYAEVRLEFSDIESLYLRNGIVEAYGFSVEGGLAVRVLKGGAFGFATTDKLDADSIRRTVESAVRLAEAQKGGEIKLSEEKTYNDSYSIKPKINAFDIPLDEKIGYLSEIDRLITGMAEDTLKIPFRNLNVIINKTDKYFVNSEGTSIRSSIPRIIFYTYYVLAYKDRTITRNLAFGGSVGWEGRDMWNILDKVKEDVSALKRVIKEAIKPPEGEYDVIIGPEVSGLATHESCGHPFELDRIFGREGAQAGESYATVDLLGKRMAKDILTIIDDPTLPNSYGFYLYDDEGVKARPRYLIKNGIVNEFLMNREYAAKLGLNSNAAARASNYNREPIVRMANTYIAAGDHTFEELLEGIKKGVYIKTFGEWNIDDRRYNQRYIGQEAYIIENGELKEPVWRPVLEITTPKYYESIDAVDKNLEFQPATCGKGDPGQGVPVYTGGPNVRLRKVRLFFMG